MKSTFAALSISPGIAFLSPLCPGLALALALTASAQSAPTQNKTPVHHRAVHKSSAPAHAKANACPGDPLPTLSATIPAVSGCPATLYSLRSVDTLAGSGTPAEDRKFLTVNYTGYLADGTVFDTSIGKRPITFPYGAHQVITGWDTGFEGMKVGGKRRLYIPYQLAYGAAGRAPVIPAKAELIFDVELLAVSDTPPQPRLPPAAPPPPTHPVPPPGTLDKPAQPALPGQPAKSATPTTDPTKPAAVAPSAEQTPPATPKL